MGGKYLDCESFMNMASVFLDKSSELCSFQVFHFQISWKPLWLLWTVLSSGILICGIPVLYFPKVIPELLRRLYKYGKARESTKKFAFLSYIEIPKSYFRHFYFSAWIYSSYIIWIVVNVYVFQKPPPKPIQFLLNIFLSKCRNIRSRPEDVFLVSLLLWLQVSKRFYECYFVSVFSRSYINIAHYIVGYFFYFASGLSLLAEAPGFSGSSGEVKSDITKEFIMNFSWHDIVGICLFLWAFMLQHRTISIFAALRKDAKGSVVTFKHKIPVGHWFDVISCPHYFAEILMYISMLIILGIQATTWWFVLYWVVSNQVMSALMSHQWYKRTFPHYPKNRKAIFPYLL